MEELDVGIDIAKTKMAIAYCPSEESYQLERTEQGIEQLKDRLVEHKLKLIVLQGVKTPLSVFISVRIPS